MKFKFVSTFGAIQQPKVLQHTDHGGRTRLLKMSCISGCVHCSNFPLLHPTPVKRPIHYIYITIHYKYTLDIVYSKQSSRCSSWETPGCTLHMCYGKHLCNELMKYVRCAYVTHLQSPGKFTHLCHTSPKFLHLWVLYTSTLYMTHGMFIVHCTCS